MKKGLLSLLAVALTIVSCQNYDDQFAELTTLVTNLQTDVAGISQVQSELTSLSATVNGLASSSTALASDLATAQASIEAITTALADVASADDLAAVTSALSDVQDDVTELLSANAVINQNVTINNDATLLYAETLISTEADDPNVIVNGTVDITVTSTNFDAAQLIRLDAITAKIATVLDAVTVSNTSTPAHAVELTALSFIDGDYTVSGLSANDDTLRTVSGNLHIGHTGAADYSQIASVGGDVEVNASVTSLDLSGATIDGGIYTSGSTAGTIILAKATAVNVGTAKVTTASLTLAEGTVNLGHVKAITGKVLIEAPKAARIDLAAKSITGSLTVTAADATAAFHAPALSTAGSTTITANEAHFNKLTQFGGNTSISAAAVAFPELSKNASGTLILSEATSFAGPKFVPTSNVTATKATTFSFKSGSDSVLNLPAVTTLTIDALGTTTDFATTAYATLVTLNVTGAEGKAPFISTVTNTLSVTAENTALTTVNILGGDIDTATVSGTAALTSLNTAGEIRNFTLNNADALVSASIGHAHIEGSDAAQFTVTNNLKLAGLTTSALDEVGHLTITNNKVLASLDMSSLVTIPFLGTYTMTIKNNALTGGFVAASAGSTTTLFVESQIKSNDLMTLMPYLTTAIASRASATTGNVTYTLDINLSDVSSTSTPQELDDAITADIAACACPTSSVAVVGIGTDTAFKALVVAE
jgi:hypothetical protein